MSNLPATNRTCIGVSWGSDIGVVSSASVNAVNQAETPITASSVAEIVKQPSVLANADGNRAPSLWLNVANDEFLLSDGAKNATLRFPQQGIYSVINLLDIPTAKKTLRKELAQNEEGGFRCLSGRPSVLKKIRVFDNDLLGEDANKEDDDDGDVEDELTNFKAMTVHTDAKDSKHAEHQGKFSLFLEQAKRNLQMDADGLVPKTTFTVEGEDDDGNPETQTETRLPETTWECAVGVCRIFRTIIKDSLSGGVNSPNSTGAGKAMPTSAGAVQENPSVIAVSVPRHRTNTYAAYSLLRLAWHDWCFKTQQTPLPTQLKVIHDDVAAFAAVLPKEKLMLSTNFVEPFAATSVAPDIALVVNWGATQLTVSVMLQTSEPITTSNNNNNTNKPTSYSKMICLASKTLDREVGGYFIDQKITDTELLVSAKRKKLPPVEKTDRGYRKFLIAAERAKLILSSSQTTSVEIESAVEGMDFVEPSFTRSKLENVITSACRLPNKFTELMNSVFAELNSSAFLPVFSASKKVNFGVILSGGVLRTPYLQNFVKNTGTQALENYLKNFSSSFEAVNAYTSNAWLAAPIDPQEICSIGACYLAQTGVLVDPMTVSSDKKRSTVFSKPQLPFLGCDICLLPNKEGASSSTSAVVVLPSGCSVPCKRQISAAVSTKDYSGLLVLNKSAKTAVRVPFAVTEEDRSMTLLFNVCTDGVLKVTDVSKSGEKVAEVQLL